MSALPRRRHSSRLAAGIIIPGLLAIALLSGCKAAQSAATPAAISAAQAVGSHVSDGTYVALGDSYTAAPLLTGQGSSPAGCLRSAQDYPALVARTLHPRSFVNVSCYGASTYDMTHPQKSLDQVNPPQLSAVSAADSLVTVQVGGDDIGFTRILTTCGELSLTDPFGSPCQDHYTDDGTDQLAQAIARTAPKMTALLDSIRHRAPHARVLLIGYPDILPASGNGCWPSHAAMSPTSATPRPGSTPCSPPPPHEPASATSTPTTPPSATTPASPRT